MLIMRAFAVKIRELRGCVKSLDGLCCQDQRIMREKVLKLVNSELIRSKLWYGDCNCEMIWEIG